jgi:hypothetical protein
MPKLTLLTVDVTFAVFMVMKVLIHGVVSLGYHGIILTVLIPLPPNQKSEQMSKWV